MDVPETRFARTTSGSTIAYQVVGDGPVTITSVPPMAQNIEMAWEWPAIRGMFEGFASFCRFVVFDKRGTGMSDRRLDIPDLDERVDELSAVLDHAGIDRTYVMGTSEGGPMALMFAATYPERVDGVILECTAATLLTDDQRDRVSRGEYDPDACDAGNGSSRRGGRPTRSCPTSSPLRSPTTRSTAAGTNGTSATQRAATRASR